MVQDHQVPGGGRCRQRIFQPLSLDRGPGVAVGLVQVAVQHEEMDRPDDKIVIAAVSRQGIEVIQIGLVAGGIGPTVTPVMVSQDRPEAVSARR